MSILLERYIERERNAKDRVRGHRGQRVISFSIPAKAKERRNSAIHPDRKVKEENERGRAYCEREKGGNYL